MARFYLPSFMGGPTWKSYVQTVLKELGYLAIWTPTTRLRLGDYGTLDSQYRWTYLGNIEADFGIKIIPKPGFKKTRQIFNNKGAAKINVVGKGKYEEIMNGGVKIEFKDKSKGVFVLFNSVTSEISNIAQITKKMSQIIKTTDDWQPEYHLMTDVTYAEKMIFMSSKKKNTKVFVEADVEVPINEIANADVNLGIQNSGNTDYSFIANHGVTPLYRLRHFEQGTGKIVTKRSKPFV